METLYPKAAFCMFHPLQKDLKVGLEIPVEKQEG